MAPLDRRRTSPSTFSLLSLALLLFSPHVLAQSAVLGIDLGTEYIKAALVKPGIPLDIVLTKDSRRKETSAIAFKASGPVNLEANEYPERLYGADALALSPRIPGDVYPNLKHILAASDTVFGDIALEAYKTRYPGLNLTGGGAYGKLGFHSKILGSQSDAFSVEELLAMELRSIRLNAQSMAGKHSVIRDAVLTVPAFYTADERRAIESAAELAGLKVIGLVSDGLAVGVNYAMTRTFTDPDKGGKAEHHLVYDMGAGSTTATVMRFRGKAVKDVGRFNKTIQEISVLGTAWDRGLGGDVLNDIIVNDMVEQFILSKGGKALQVDADTIKKQGRVMAKLTRDAERSRQVLSANTETTASFEGLYEEVDFKYKITRSKFETMAADFVSRVGQPLTAALEKAGLTMEELDSVILHGGLIRTPFVQNALEALVGDPAKLKSNVNADEAAVFGAAFKAAGLSSSFKVKEIKDRDAASYSATVHWTSNGKDRKQTVFQSTSITGTMKEMPFKLVEDFNFTITQSVPGLADEVLSKSVVAVQVANLTATVQELVDKWACARNNISTTISFHLDPASGLPAAVKGTASCESDVSEKQEGLFDGVKGMFGFGKKDQKALDDDDVDEVEAVLPDVPESSSTSSKSSKKASKTSSSSSGSASKSSGAASKETKAVVNNKFHSIPLKIVSSPAGAARLDASILTTVKSRLSAFDTSDRNRAKRSETFNSLESLTYRARDLLTDKAFLGVSSESQRSAIESALSTTSEWLSIEGAEATYEKIKDKLTGLQGLVDPVKARVNELSRRPASIQALKDALNSTQSIMGVIREQIDRAATAADESAKEALKAVSSTLADAIPTADADASEATSTTSGSGNAEELDDFSDADSSSATSSTSSKASRSTKSSVKPTPSVNPFSLSAFTEEDYTSLSTLYTSASEWLSETSLAQEALAVYEDPSQTVADLERKAKQLGDATNEMLRKMMRRADSYSSSYTKPKSSKTSSSKVKVPTPKVSVVSEGEDGAATPMAVEEDPAGNEPVIQEPAPTDIVLDGDTAPGAESTTEPEATPQPGGADLPVHEEL